MTQFLKFIIYISILVGCASCAFRSDKEYTSVPEKNSIYHWKTTFAPDSSALGFLRKHDIGRLYIRMFDVSIKKNYAENKTDIVPVATTDFEVPVPDSIEVVPVTFITIEALRQMRGEEAKYAELIVERLLAMCSYNKCGQISEIQFDCDWTSSTKDIYTKLCKTAKSLLEVKNIDLSITVRLHQLTESAPDVDRGVLMLYNTGAFKNFDTRNSILDIRDAKIYLKKLKYSIPLDYAYPVFGWGIKFRDEKFVSIVRESDIVTEENEYIRYERPSVESILEVKKLVEQQLGKPYSGNILYHFDNKQLNNYTDNEIGQIIAY